MKIFVSILLCYCFSSLTAQSFQSNQNSALLFCSYLQQNKLDSAYEVFDQKAKNQMSKSLFEGTWNSIIQKMGVLERYSLNLHKEVNSSVVIVYCEFSQNKIDMKIPFSETNKILGFTFIPHTEQQKNYALPGYDNPTKYVEKEIIIKSTVALPAMQTIPLNNKQFPIAIFIHGSGPNDKDETIGPNKIFKDLSIGLALNGIASIRYDKRTYVNKKLDTVTVEKEIIDDVLEVIKYIESNNELKGRKIFLIGHSLGAMIAPEIALRSEKVTGIVCLAASPRRLEELLIDQVKYLANSDNLISSSEQEQINILSKQIQFMRDSITAECPSEKLPMGLPASYWLSLQKYDYLKVMKSNKKPLFVLQGEKDYQVTMKDFNLIKDSLANRSETAFKVYPALNHLFLENNGEIGPNQYYFQSNVPYYVIEDISKWINKY